MKHEQQGQAQEILRSRPHIHRKYTVKFVLTIQKYAQTESQIFLKSSKINNIFLQKLPLSDFGFEFQDKIIFTF